MEAGAAVTDGLTRAGGSTSKGPQVRGLQARLAVGHRPQLLSMGLWVYSHTPSLTSAIVPGSQRASPASLWEGTAHTVDHWRPSGGRPLSQAPTIHQGLETKMAQTQLSPLVDTHLH